MLKLQLLILLAVILAEHFLLTRVYKKTSSLQRLLGAGPSARTDVVLWSAGTFAAWASKFSWGWVFHLLAVPGLVAGALELARSRFSWHGPLFPVDSWWAQVLVFLAARDLLAYVAHWAQHRFSFLWRYHRLHHSATEFSIITGVRVSWGDRFVNALALGLLVAVFGLPDPLAGFVLTLAIRVLDLMQHSDLPWDFGILGYLLASPRFHRMHHSDDPRDHDTNFGNLFSFWDYLSERLRPAIDYGRPWPTR